MCQAVLSPNLTKKFQWEVSQIADNRFPCVMLLGGLSVNLNHLKRQGVKLKQSHQPKMTPKTMTVDLFLGNLCSFSTISNYIVSY